MRLRLFIGLRATEALSIRIKDLDLESTPAKLFVRGEYTKTRTDRVVFLIGEIMQQLNSWLSYKYRTRRASSGMRLGGFVGLRDEDIRPIYRSDRQEINCSSCGCLQRNG